MTSLVAGALGMDVARVVVAGTVGRLLHFGAVAWLGNLIAHAF
jgi:membrane protein YqaA with SNARE-associated domain